MTAGRINLFRIALLMLAILLLAAGIYLREPGAVEERAVAVCLDCIGIGN